MSATKQPGHGARRSSAVLAIVFVAGAIVGGLPGSSEPVVFRPTATDSVGALPPETTAPSPTAPSPGCDPVDQLFVGMFTALTDVTLANAGVDHGAFLAAVAGDWATAKRYLETLGLAVDDEQLEALFAVGFPTASNLPLAALGGC